MGVSHFGAVTGLFRVLSPASGCRTPGAVVSPTGRRAHLFQGPRATGERQKPKQRKAAHMTGSIVINSDFPSLGICRGL